MLAINKLTKKTILFKTNLLKCKLAYLQTTKRNFSKLETIRIDTRLSDPVILKERSDIDTEVIENRNASNLKALIIEEIKK